MNMRATWITIASKNLTVGVVYMTTIGVTLVPYLPACNAHERTLGDRSYGRRRHGSERALGIYATGELDANGVQQWTVGQAGVMVLITDTSAIGGGLGLRVILLWTPEWKCQCGGHV